MSPSHKRPLEQHPVTTTATTPTTQQQQQQQLEQRTSYGTRSLTTPGPAPLKRIRRLPSSSSSFKPSRTAEEQEEKESVPGPELLRNARPGSHSGSGSGSDSNSDSERSSGSRASPSDNTDDDDDDDDDDNRPTVTQELSSRSTINRSRSRSSSKDKSIPRRPQCIYPDPTMRRRVKPLTTFKDRAVMASDFLQLFKDPPQAAKLQDHRRCKGAISAFLKQEAVSLALTNTTIGATASASASSSSSTTTAAAETLKTSSSPPSYRKLNFTSKNINQFRIFVAAQFLIDRLRLQARLSDPTYGFRITYTSSAMFETFASDMARKYTVVVDGQTPSSSLISPISLFKGVSGNSLLGLYCTLVYRAHELETFQISSTPVQGQQGQQRRKENWTPTRMSKIAMELLELDRAVCERYNRLHSARSRGDENDGGVGGVQVERGGGRGTGYESKAEGGTRAGSSGIKSVKRRRGKKREEEISDGELMENQDDNNNGRQGKHSSLILSEYQSVNRTEYQNRDNGGGTHDQVYRDSLGLDEGTVVGSGSRDDLWEVVTVQARIFQELADEVVSLRKEVAQSKMKGKSSKSGDDATDVVTGLKEEVARLQKKDKMREFETKTKFREMEDKLAFLQEEIMKLIADKEN